MRPRSSLRSIGTLGVLAGLVVGACSPAANTASSAAPSATTAPAATATAAAPSQSAAAENVAITVVSLKPGSEEAAFDAFDAQVDQFEDANPDIDIIGPGVRVDRARRSPRSSPAARCRTCSRSRSPTASRSSSRASSRTSPPGQRAAVRRRSSTPTCSPPVRTRAAHIFALPRRPTASASSTTASCSRQAGLDPDKPPTTWDEVRAAAKAIADKTGQAGYLPDDPEQHRWLAC